MLLVLPLLIRVVVLERGSQGHLELSLLPLLNAHVAGPASTAATTVTSTTSTSAAASAALF